MQNIISWCTGELTPKEKAQKSAEHKAYSRVCKTPITPTGDPCQDAKANLERLKRCLQMRKDFQNKWYPDKEHQEIENTEKAVKNAEEKVNLLCGGAQ